MMEPDSLKLIMILILLFFCACASKKPAEETSWVAPAIDFPDDDEIEDLDELPEAGDDDKGTRSDP